MKVLIAEKDFKAINDITTSINLCFPDWDLITTDSGKECLKRVRDNPLDVVIRSPDLADTSSLDVLKEIRGLSDTAIIFLSSKNDWMSMVRPLHLGADQCIEKPFSQLELVTRIKALLRRVSVENRLIKTQL
jgi:two-component system response regulator VicR